MTALRYLPRFREAHRHLSVMTGREAWPRDQITRFQLDRLNQVWSHAIEKVPFYRQLSESLGARERFQDLAEYTAIVPILDKSLVRATPEQFLSDTPSAGKWHRTGGSTGVPMGVFWEHQAHREMLRCKYRFEQKFGLDIFDRKVTLWGHSGSFAPGMKGHAQRMIQPFADRLRNRLRRSAYHLGTDDLAKHLAEIQRFRPASIYGYSSAVYLLAREAKRLGIEIPSLKLVIVTAEPADESLRESTAAALKTRVVAEYGSVECGVMAFHDPDGLMRIREDVCYLETVPRDDGRYDIVVSVLNNPSFPLLRYRIEDVTDHPKTVADLGFSTLTNVAGRNNDVLHGRDGGRLHSMAIKHVLEHDPAIRRFQAIQRSDGSLDVKIEADVDLTQTCESLRARMEAMLEGFPVRLQKVASIDGNLAGKHRWIVSEVDNV